MRVDHPLTVLWQAGLQPKLSPVLNCRPDGQYVNRSLIVCPPVLSKGQQEQGLYSHTLLGMMKEMAIIVA